MKKVPASEATRKRLEEVFSGEHIDPSRIVREATRLMIEQALEAEEAVGWRYYTQGKGVEDDGPRALRNGVRRGCINSAEGVIEFDAPQGGTLGAGGQERTTHASGRGDVCPWALDARHRNGLHRRGRALRAQPHDGQRGVRAAVERYHAFAQRDLSEIDIVYLFLDGVAERLQLGAPREAVLAAWGIDESGTKNLLALLPG